MSIDKVSMVLIDLTILPVGGSAHMMIRISQEDKNMVDLAAQTLGLTQADFLRVAVVNTANKVISENAR